MILVKWRSWVHMQIWSNPQLNSMNQQSINPNACLNWGMLAASCTRWSAASDARWRCWTCQVRSALAIVPWGWMNVIRPWPGHTSLCGAVWEGWLRSHWSSRNVLIRSHVRRWQPCFLCMICPGMCWVRIIMDGRWNGFANGACSLFERQLFEFVLVG